MRRQTCHVAGTVLAAGLLLAACEQQNKYVAPPPPRVTVALPVQQPVTRYIEATGNTAAVNSTNLVARVQGFLQEIRYRDGDVVKKGTVLFVIEPEPYRIKLEQAKAAEAAAEASVKQTEAEYHRQTELASRQVASKQALDNATANRESAAAKFKQAQDDTRQAAINLDYTDVKAPFDGVVTARLVSIGELVGGATPTQLATIVQFDPMYVNFTISEQDVLRVRADMTRRGITRDDLLKLPVEFGLQTETGYPHKGELNYIAPTLNQSTGTLAVRAEFENSSRTLLPGYFVRVRVPFSQETQALLVPNVAIGADQGGRYVLVVNEQNIVEQRKVTIGPTVDELRVIESGLKPDDRVVVAGALRAIPGQAVEPQMQEAPPRSDAPPRDGAKAQPR
jgi:RND family efflux transporter MFP subunit